MREYLLDSLDYDVWANRKWIGFLGGVASAESAAGAGRWMHHILTAQHIWVTRLGVDVPEVVAYGPEVSAAQLRAEADRLADAWRTVLRERDPGEAISYKNFKGETLTRTLGQLARHAMNHGTYHRGQIREIVEQLGMSDFPETDYLYFLAARDAGKL